MNSKVVIQTTDNFERSIRKLSRKYPSFKNDLVTLKSTLLDNPQSGASLGKDCYKVRMKIASKNTGKSGGARVITYVKLQAERITLLDIYDKSEKESISEKELDALIKIAEA